MASSSSGATSGDAESVTALATPPEVAVLLLFLWAASGLATACVMGRRGHDFRPAAALGLVFGPLFIPLAVDAVRHREPEAKPRRLSEGGRRSGPVDVLVGLVGPAEGLVHALPTLRALGPRLGKVAIAAAVDFESAASDDWSDAKGRAALELELASALLAEECQPATVLVPGAPQKAFLRYAAEAGYDFLLVAGDGPTWRPGQRHKRGAAARARLLPVTPAGAAR